MSSVADQYVRMGGILKEGIEGLGRRARQAAEMDFEESKFQAQLADPRAKLARAEAQDELAVRGQAFDPRGIVDQSPLAGGVAGPPASDTGMGGAEAKEPNPAVQRKQQELMQKQQQAKGNAKKLVKSAVGNNPHHQIHFANTLYPELNRKFGWTFGGDGNLYSKGGRVITNEDFNRTGARLMMKAYSDPMKYLEGEVAMVDQQLQGIDPSIPANQKTLEDLQGRKTKLNEVYGRMKENPAGVAKMKYDAILKLAHHVPNNADFTYEIDRARLDYTKALESDIRSGKMPADSIYRVSMYSKDGDGYKVKHLYIPKVNPDGSPNVFDERHPEFKKENLGGTWLAGMPSDKKEDAVKEQTKNQRYSVITRVYEGRMDALAKAHKDKPFSSQDLRDKQVEIKNQATAERWRISQGRPTAAERGIEVDEYGFYEGEIAKGKDGKEYRYDGKDTWVPVKGKGYYRRNRKAGRFETDDTPYNTPNQPI